MNKATKGALAAGAAALLLLGGAGSYALWTDSETVTGGSINTGTLDITAGAGTWASTSGAITDIGAFRMVPGDIVTYATTLTVTAIGDNLDAEFVVGSAGLPTITPGPDDLTGTDIGTVVRNATDFTVATSVTTSAGVPVATITEANDGDVLNVNAIITFKPETGAQNSVNTTVSFTNFAITVNQV